MFRGAFDLAHAKSQPVLDDFQVVVHAAAGVHVMNETWSPSQTW